MDNLKFDCEWMNNPKDLKEGDNWCPLHMEDQSKLLIRHGWYKCSKDEISNV